MMKFLMVCLGNICRSPLAEGILQHKADALNLNWTVDSAGTGNWHVGNPPHRLSQKVALQNGVDISHLRGRQFTGQDMIDFDHVYFMDTDNYNDAKFIAGELWNSAKAHLLLNEVYPGKNRSVPDPYYGGEQDFQDVFEMVSRACEAIVKKYGNNNY